jgi:BlaR1 peptidase M56
MNPWSEMVFDWLVDYYALTTVVLVAAVAAMSWLRQPARRLSIARSGVVGLAILSILAALPGWPRASWRVVPARTESAPLPITVPSEHESGVVTSVPLAARIEPPREAAFSHPLPAASAKIIRAEGRSVQPAPGESADGLSVEPMPNWPVLAGRAFLAGVGLMLVWLGIGLWQTTAIRRRSRPAPQWSRDALAWIVDDGLAVPDLLVSDELSQPVAVGLLRPSILLPDRFVDDEPQGRLEAALAHEWAHIRNWDLWWIALSRLLMPVLFAHPVYWWLRWRTRDDQELLADANAANGRVDYAEALLSWARATPVRPRLAVAGSLALWERRSQLKRRIVMLLDRNFRVEFDSPRWWRLSVRTGTVLAVLALSLLTLRPDAVSANPPIPLDKNLRQEPERVPQVKTTEANVECSARLLDPDGKPFAGAKVYRSDVLPTDLDHPLRTAVLLGTTGPDGSFKYPKQSVPEGDQLQQVVVMADGYGPAFVDPSMADGAKVLRLVKDDVSIKGRILDIQGQPVAGATVQVVGLLWPPSAKLDAWLEALKSEKVAFPVQYLLRDWSSDDIPSLFPAVTTDHDGRFTLRGIGRERIVSLLVSGPHIETRFEYVATRDMPTEKFPDFDQQSYGHDITYHGAAFELVAGPGLEVVGTVRDKDTGKPLAGVTVQNTAAFGNPLRPSRRRPTPRAITASWGSHRRPTSATSKISWSRGITGQPTCHRSST